MSKTMINTKDNEKMNTLIKVFAGIAIGIATSLFLFSAKGLCADGKVELKIGDRYAFVSMPNVDIEGLSEADVCTTIENRRKDISVDRLQVFMYPGRARSGEKIIGLAESTKGDCFFVDMRDKQDIISMLDHGIGLQIKPNDLYSEFEKNEIAAMADLAGKPMCMSFSISDIGLDPFRRPYVTVNMDKMGLNRIQVILNKADPFLRHIKKGQRIAVRAYPENFILNILVMNGYIVSNGKMVLMEGNPVEHPFAGELTK